LACIIPVVGNTHGLETTLVSVLERRPDTCEVLVVLNVPYHDPYGLQGEIQILQAPPEAGIVDCVNLGISTTCAPVVHLLATGLEANHGWIERALAHFDDPRVAAVTPLIYDRANHERLLAAGVSYGRGGRKNVHRSVPAEGEFSCAPIGPLIQAAFYRKSALDALGGGLPTDVGDHLADVDLSLSLRQAGWRLELEPDSQVFASSIDDQLPGGFSTGLWSERLYWRHFTEADKLAGLFSHPLVVLQELIKSKPPWKAPAQFIGRLVALCQPGHYRKHQQMLTASRNDARAEQAQSQTNLEVAAGPSRVPSAKQHRVDTPHQGVKPQNSNQQRHTYRRKKRH
jgi:GT2 family glycosyltransferase